MTHINAVVLRIAHDLGGCIKAHGLGIQQRRGKNRWIMAFEPGRDIDKMGEARSMAFGESIFAETFDLIKTAMGKFRIIAAFDHASDHLLLKPAYGAAAPECGHGLTQFIDFTWGEFSRHHGQAHGLLLEQGHAHGLAEDGS